jgi:hypothetical protein
MMNSEYELPIQPEQLVSEVHYESIRFGMGIVNTTAGTTIKEEDAAQVIQILDMGFELELPKNSCASGHHLMIELYVQQPGGTTLLFGATTKVVAIENIFENRDRVEVKLVQFSEESWNKLRQMLERRQEEIYTFMRSARGHA